MIVTGVTARGIIMPIFHEGDALVEIIAQQIVKAAATEGFTLQEGDIVCVTESIVARAQGNYVTCDEIAEDVKRHFPGPVLGIYNPILSRNRAAIQLKAVAQGVEKVIIQLTYPCDEVGNALISWDQIDEHKVNPHLQDFDEEGFAQTFGKTKHLFTGVDYVEYYKNLSDNINIVFSNDTCHLLKYTDQVLCFDVHSRQRSQRLLLQAGAKVALGLDHLMTTSIDGSGFNPTYGLLGSNKASEERLKLFPRDCQPLVEALQQRLQELTGKLMEVMVYGDGGFKDPLCGIWELHDPVISPAYTEGLRGMPNEIKMKYIVDDELGHLRGEELREELRRKIQEKPTSLVGDMSAEGTTPRQLADLLGSLADLISGSGDRGTPVVLVQGYFRNYAST